MILPLLFSDFLILAQEPGKDKRSHGYVYSAEAAHRLEYARKLETCRSLQKDEGGT